MLNCRSFANQFTLKCDFIRCCLQVRLASDLCSFFAFRQILLLCFPSESKVIPRRRSMSASGSNLPGPSSLRLHRKRSFPALMFTTSKQESISSFLSLLSLSPLFFLLPLVSALSCVFRKNMLAYLSLTSGEASSEHRRRCCIP